MHQTGDPTLEIGWRWFQWRFVMLAQCMTCTGPWRASALKLAPALKFNGAGGESAAGDEEINAVLGSQDH